MNCEVIRINYGDVASIVTLIMFIIFIIGRGFTTRKLVTRRFDKLEVLNIPEDEVENNFSYLDNYIDLGGLQLIKISSQVKIKKINVYEIEYFDHSDEESKYNKNLVTETRDIEPQDCLYMYIELGETMSKYFLEITYLDYSMASYKISEDRRDGKVCKENYKVRVTIKTFMYYLFS